MLNNNIKSTLVLSAHCDDAILSIGGFLLNEDSSSIEIADIFGTCAWTVLDTNLGTDEITKLNIEEENEVSRITNITVNIFDNPEALLRDYKNWNDSISNNDNALISNITTTITSLVKNRKRVFFPMAIGEHVDHAILFNIVLNLIPIINDDCEIFMYEDLPYAWYEDPVKYLETKTIAYPVKPIIIDISSCIKDKLKLLHTYKSQLSIKELQKVEEYARRVNNGTPSERIWKIQH